jgi:hypothetical protein
MTNFQLTATRNNSNRKKTGQPAIAVNTRKEGLDDPTMQQHKSVAQRSKGFRSFMLSRAVFQTRIQFASWIRITLRNEDQDIGGNFYAKK